jgi:xanthine dehydrogenase YagR molybdenum-binding subunit
MAKKVDHEIRVGFSADDKKITVQEESGLRPWDLDTQHKVVGTDVNRIDGLDKATGRAKYAFDKNLPGMLYGAILRSPHAKATLVSVDLTEALRAPGVKAAVQYLNDGNQVRFLGHEIAAVAAETQDQAYDALELINARFDVERHNTDYLKAENAPAVNGELEVTEPWPTQGAEAVETALADADISHTATYKVEVQTHSCLESHGVVAKWTGNDLEMWASTQGTFSMQSGVSRTLATLGTPANSVRVYTEFMGGGFGGKLSPGAEPVVCCLLAKQANAPVKLMLNRFEEHTCVGHRPGALMQIRAGVDNDGTLKVWDYRSFGDPGYGGRGGNTTPPAHYIANATRRARAAGRGRRGRGGGGGPRLSYDIQTDNNQGRAMRAPGWPQGYFAAEVFLDELAVKVGMDPVEFRAKNDPQVIRKEQWQIGADRFGWTERHNPEPGEPRAGEDPRYLRGAGLSSARWGGMGSSRGNSGVICRIHSDGTVEARNGAQDIGTGMKTVMALITAEELQIPLETVKVAMGDTNDPSGPGSGGSTTTPTLAPVVRHAAGLAKEQLMEKVAESLQMPPERMVYEDARIGDPLSRMMSFADACKLIGPNPIEATGRRFANYEAYNNGVCGCQFAEVVVDSWTGVVSVKKMLAVQDCGLVIAKKLAESQVIGAMIQGLSYALFENRTMDHRAGRMVNGDMLFYKIAGPNDMPELEAVMVSVANGANNVGAVGLGEPPSVAAPAAIANAVANAVGVPVRSLPITPDKVLKALSQRKGV